MSIERNGVLAERSAAMGPSSLSVIANPALPTPVRLIVE